MQSIKLVTEQRAEQILNCYGASELAWPTAEREAVQGLIRRSEYLQTLYHQAQQLDQVLLEGKQISHLPIDAQQLSSQILAGIGEQHPQTVDEKSDNRHFSEKTSEFRFSSQLKTWALAATLAGLALFISQPSITPTQPIIVAQFTAEDDLRMLQELTESTDNTIISSGFETLMLLEPALAPDEILI